MQDSYYIEGYALVLAITEKSLSIRAKVWNSIAGWKNT